MARKPLGKRQHARKFNKAHNRHRAINNPPQVMRGGFRL